MVAPKRNLFAVITLFLVAPLVAEYLLGDLPLKLLTALIVLAPAYGCGAVLIRETARRTGRGWPTMLMLGAAYTLIGEGLVSQSLFNQMCIRDSISTTSSGRAPLMNKPSISLRKIGV